MKMHSNRKLWLTAALIVLWVLGCNGGTMDEKRSTFKALSEVPVSKWQQLSKMNIYFGHQSVGNNILDGINDIMEENPQIKLNIIKSSDFNTNDEGSFFQSPIGKNTDPVSKMKDFEEIMTSKSTGQIDIAFMKLCYVDITAKSKPEEIFRNYIETIERIKEENNKTQIIHFTVPLTKNQSGIKSWIKGILGKPLNGYKENANRFEYNRRVLSYYEGKEPVFDIARIESTRPNGQKMAYKQDGNEYFSLAPEYTYDGGHLNELGRKMAAEKMLILLANQI